MRFRAGEHMEVDKMRGGQTHISPSASIKEKQVTCVGRLPGVLFRNPR